MILIRKKKIDKNNQEIVKNNYRYISEMLQVQYGRCKLLSIEQVNDRVLLQYL